MLVGLRDQLLVKGLLFLQTGDEDLEELLQGSHSEVLSAVVVDGHLLHLSVLIDQLSLLTFKRRFPPSLRILRTHDGIRLVWLLKSVFFIQGQDK